MEFVIMNWKLTSLNGCSFSFLVSIINGFLYVRGVSRLGGVMVSVLAIGPRVHVLKPGRGDEFLREMKVRSTPFFRRGNKAVGPM
jgi:hypothetical protein